MSLLRALRGGGDPPPKGPKRINLALQGGGVYGAFTWGVLDHLIKDGRLGVDGISGTSAGAVNAVMLADGLKRGGADEARKRLADFWKAVSLGGDLPELQRNVLSRLFSLVPSGQPGHDWLSAWSRYLSPYDFNPLNINPLKDLIERFVDFEGLRADPRPLFIAATNVQTGRLHIFPHDKISAEAVMASACLPTVFRAVEIDGVSYWDGGYLGNPVLFPFFRATDTEDVLIVQINPLVRRKIPHSNREIMARVSEITFNSSLMGELRAIRFVNRQIELGPAAARHRPRPIPPHQGAPHRAGGLGRAVLVGAAACATITNPSSCCASWANARRGGFSTRITRISGCAAASIWMRKCLRSKLAP